jgi:succinoglycan biosynthesis transport protein ExoP
MEFNTVSDYLAVWPRRKKSMIAVASLVIMISIGFAFGLPSIYQSTATILIEQQEIPSELVQTTISSYADERIQRISKRVMTSVNLDNIIKEYDLYSEERRSEGLESVRKRLTQAITLEMVSAEVLNPRSGREQEATIAFKVSYSSKSPELAQAVTKELVSLYLEENRASRIQTAAGAAEFLEEQAKALKEQISGVENELAAFKKQHIGELPEQVELNLNLIERAEGQLLETQRDIRDLEERKIYLQSELAQISPHAAVFSPDGEKVLSPEERLKGLRVQYASLSGVYSPDHPDLVRMRREIQALQKELGLPRDSALLEQQMRSAREQLANARERYSDAHPDVKRLQRMVKELEAQLREAANNPRATIQPVSKPDNPAYIQLKANLEAANAELGSLKRTQGELKQKLSVYEQRLTNIPQVERQYRALTREYDSLLEEYREIKDKQRTAELAESLEEGQKGERFTVLEPPRLPDEPARPNRMAILFLGVVVSFAGGVGTAAVAEMMDETVRGRKDLAELINASPLAVIPYIETKQDLRDRRWRQGLAAVGVIIIAVVIAAIVHWRAKPLDQVWLDVSQQVGVQSQKSGDQAS